VDDVADQSEREQQTDGMQRVATVHPSEGSHVGPLSRFTKRL
jgi:hypothetical protein